MGVQYVDECWECYFLNNFTSNIYYLRFIISTSVEKWLALKPSLLHHACLLRRDRFVVANGLQDDAAIYTTRPSLVPVSPYLFLIVHVG